MTTAGPSKRFIYYGDGTANLGVNLTGTDGQAGAWTHPGIENALQELTGNASINPVFAPVGYQKADDFVLPIWADANLQELIDDIEGVTPADRNDVRVLALGWASGDVVAKKVDIGSAYLMKSLAKTPPAGLTLLETTWRWADIMYPGADILLPLGAKTADFDTSATYFDGSAASTAGGVAFFIYIAYVADGATGLVVRVMDSADHITFGALATFTAITATTGGAQAKAVSGNVKRYLDVDGDFTGSPGASTSCTLFVAFKRL